MGRATVYRCGCGRRRRQHAGQCDDCYRKRREALRQEAQAHVERGTCPLCGTRLVRNLALTGWWQCGAYASESHRRPEFVGLPACAFQCFTE